MKSFFNRWLLPLWYSFGTVPFQIALSFILAFILFQDIKGKSTWRIIYFLPYVTVTVASAAVWQSIFDPTKGFINMAFNGVGHTGGLILPRWLFDATGIGVYIGERLGVTLPEWMGGPSLALVAVMVYNVWTYVGYNAVIYLAGLGNIPTALYEAAQIDGANRLQVLLKITIPLVSPTTYFLGDDGGVGYLPGVQSHLCDDERVGTRWRTTGHHDDGEYVDLEELLER